MAGPALSTESKEREGARGGADKIDGACDDICCRACFLRDALSHGEPCSSCTCYVHKIEEMNDGAITHQIIKQLILEKVYALDDVLVIHIVEEENFGGEPAVAFIVDPSVVGHLVLDDEFDGHLVSCDAVLGSHNKTITARPKLILELIGTREPEIKVVALGELLRVASGVEHVWGDFAVVVEEGCVRCR